jgi:hypothetical protein
MAAVFFADIVIRREWRPTTWLLASRSGSPVKRTASGTHPARRKSESARAEQLSMYARGQLIWSSRGSQSSSAKWIFPELQSSQQTIKYEDCVENRETIQDR